MSKLNKKLTPYFFTSKKGEEQKCIWCHNFTSKKTGLQLATFAPTLNKLIISYHICSTVWWMIYSNDIYVSILHCHLPKTKTFLIK